MKRTAASASRATGPTPPKPVMGPVRSVLVLGALSIFGPLSMDLYLPSLPQLAGHLDTTDALAQATMSTCLIGLGAGQLIAGPISDRIGRKRPLLVGVGLFALLGLLCALAPNIQLLIVLRLAQGLAGATGLVISLAMARDLYGGARLARMLAMLSLVGSTAPVIAPMVGGQLVKVMDWRGIFLVLAGVGAALFLIALIFVRETLPPAGRHTGGAAASIRQFSVLVRDRGFIWLVIASGVAGAAFFSYLAMCSFVFQNEFAVSPEHFSWIFAGNAVAMLVGAQSGALVVRRIGPRRMYLIGISAEAVAVAVLLVAVVADAALPVVLIALCSVMFMQGLTGPNATALALGGHGSRAGTAASVMGTANFVVGPVVAPIASLGGTTGLTMALTMMVATGLAVSIAWLRVLPLTADAARGSTEPPVGIEPTTYSLRVNRSTD